MVPLWDPLGSWVCGTGWGWGVGFLSLGHQHIPKMVLSCLNTSHFLLISITISKVKNVFLNILIEMQQRMLMREMVS